MGFTKRQRTAVGIGVLAIGALVADRLVLLPGPAGASAAVLSGDGAEATIVDMKALSGLAEKLLGVCTSNSGVNVAVTSTEPVPDPFASPWAKATASLAAADEATGTTTKVVTPTALPALTAIVSANGRGYGVLDGQPLSVGASRNGYTLIELTDQAARIMIDGEVHTLPLRK